MLASQVPDTPLAPTTSISDSDVTITWSTPYNGGQNILSYRIEILKSDLTTYTTDLTDCDGSDPAIVAATSCSVPIATLRADPFLLPWGSSIWARIIATNVNGDSSASSDGNGAIILTNPDAPYNLLNDESLTSG